MLTFQKLLGACALGFGSLRIFNAIASRDHIHPYSSHGWVTEQLCIGLVYVLIGLSLLHKQVAGPRSFKALIASLSLAAVSFCVFLRYFSLAVGLFAIVGLLNATFVSATLDTVSSLTRGLAFVVSSVLLIAATAFVAASFYLAAN